MENSKQNDMQNEDRDITLVEAGANKQDRISTETGTDGKGRNTAETSTDGQSIKEAETGPTKGLKENLYDKIPLTVKQLDIIIILLILAFIFFFVFGALKGRGIL